MIIMIDNYDSFTYNLVQYFGSIGQDLTVFRNDKVTVEEIKALSPDLLVISPGPCSPHEAGISVELIKQMSGLVPIFGVCLGHQSIGAAFGGDITRAGKLMHGKTSMITHDGKGLFAGMPNPFQAIRYHSLVISKETLPDCLDVTAHSEDGEIMGVRHKDFQVEGVQFHPESILTHNSMKIIENFIGFQRNYEIKEPEMGQGALR